MIKSLRKRYLVTILLIIIILTLFFLIKPYKVNIDHIQSFGVLAPIVFIFIMTLAIIVSPIPSLPLAVISGIIWGPYLGTFYSVLGAEIGAMISFYISRMLGRPLVEKLLGEYISLSDRYTQKKLPWIVFLTRLLPIFQFDIISYGAGLTKMRLGSFAIATFFGMIPVTFLLFLIPRSLLRVG